MDDSHDQPGRSLPTSQFSRIDKACDRFEAALRAGKKPSIDVYLEDVSEPHRWALKRELLAVEAAYSKQKQAAPSLDQFIENLAGSGIMSRGDIRGLIEQLSLRAAQTRRATGQGAPASEEADSFSGSSCVSGQNQRTHPWQLRRSTRSAREGNACTKRQANEASGGVEGPAKALTKLVMWCCGFSARWRHLGSSTIPTSQRPTTPMRRTAFIST